MDFIHNCGFLYTIVCLFVNSLICIFAPLWGVGVMEGMADYGGVWPGVMVSGGLTVNI